MDHDASPPGIELRSVSDFSSPYQPGSGYQSRNRSAISSSLMGDECLLNTLRAYDFPNSYGSRVE